MVAADFAKREKTAPETEGIAVVCQTYQFRSATLPPNTRLATQTIESRLSRLVLSTNLDHYAKFCSLQNNITTGTGNFHYKLILS